MREVGNYRHSNGEASSSTTSGFNNQMKYSSSAQQSAGSNSYMPTIAENESWNESSLNCLKRTQEGDFKVFSATFNGMGSQVEIQFNSTQFVFLIVYMVLLLLIIASVIRMGNQETVLPG